MHQSKSLNGLLLILSSPSGGGKTTVRTRLLELVPDLYFSVSCTTRKPRVGEVDGKDYSFISPEEFERRREKNEFLEHAQVFQYSYGTPAKEIDEAIDRGQDVLLDIDTQGALQVRSQRPSVLIFILPPSLETLKGRLYSRKTDSESQIMIRLNEARRELKCILNYDYAVVNDNIDVTVEKIRSIMIAEKHRTSRQKPFIEKLQHSILKGEA
ncbi:MAG: guanylate kinase [Chlamydiae bacterium]|nr:guanylate kinase [Chlamydiota bacterium]MBI3277848.1 guanylate kinase [Chlamydiota bacterium]